MVAVLYDIHGNLPALEAVLLDAAQAGAERFVLGGDYALFGPWPAETVERLRELDATWIRGNGERWTAQPNDAPEDGVVRSAIGACRDELGPELVGELAALPEALVDRTTRYCHGSPVSDVRSFFPDPRRDDDERDHAGAFAAVRIAAIAGDLVSGQRVPRGRFAHRRVHRHQRAFGRGRFPVLRLERAS